jgi:hypothetical protein
VPAHPVPAHPVTDVIVTGLPRSGSTAVSALIDYLPNAVSLNGPPWSVAVAQKSLDVLPFCKWIAGDFLWHRTLLANQEPVRDLRGPDGTPLLDGLHKSEPIFFARPGLSGDFILAMRHHALFTSVLPTLVKFRHFKIIAVIRHPFDVLSSWMKQGGIPIFPGHGIEHYWPEALQIAHSPQPLPDRMAQLYDAFLGRYHEAREHIEIVKFEDVLEQPLIISKLFNLDTPSAAAPMLQSRTRILMSEDSAIFRESLKKYGVFTKLYYPDI